MKLTHSLWEPLSAYIFLDRKIDRSSRIFLHSRFRLIATYHIEHDVPFTRHSFNSFLQTKIDQGCKNSYLNNIIKVGIYIHDYLLQEYQYDSGMGGYSYFKKEIEMIDILTPSECLAIANLDYPYKRGRKEKNTFYRCFYLLLTLTGVRKDEALNLKWSDVSQDALRINKTKTNVGRIIPNNKMLYNAFYDLTAYRKSEYVFAGDRTKIVGIHTVREDLLKRVAALKIKKKVWIHLFRHSFCVEMLRNNDVTLVAKLMGHADLSSTLTYSHYLLDDMKLAIMSHSLLRENQTLDNIGKKVKDVVRRLVDKATYDTEISEAEDSFILKIKKHGHIQTGNNPLNDCVIC